MNFEELQKAWQAQDQNTKVVINADALLREVRRNQQQFRVTIFWRDFREVFVAVILAIYFFQRGFRTNWTDWLVALACGWIAVFMIIDRARQRRQRAATNDALKACLESSRGEVRHQIWLLRNVFWWYLLPLAAGLAISIAHSALALEQGDSSFLVGYMVFCVLLFWGIWWLNQYAVRKTLQPRLDEIEALLGELGEG